MSSTMFLPVHAEHNKLMKYEPSFRPVQTERNKTIMGIRVGYSTETFL